MTIFEKIINKEISAKIEYEDDDCIVIHDINPQAPIHLLIVPKKFFINIPEIKNSDFSFGAKVFQVAYLLSKKIKGAEEFRLQMNNGKSVGQCVFHAHVHFLAGF